MVVKLYVSNLPYSTVDSDLENLFSNAGEVESVQVIKDRMSGRSKGFGFVEMSSREDALNAIKMFNGKDFNGRALAVGKIPKLHVGNLPYSTVDSDLENLFSNAGEVESVQVIKDRMSGRSKGFGFVGMSTYEDALDAIKMFHGKDFNGRVLTVRLIEQEEDVLGDGADADDNLYLFSTTQARGRLLRVFLCHSSGDKPTVRKLYHQLGNESWIDPWLDEEKLLPGENWALEIRRAVNSADIVIVCLSNKSINKEGYVQKEIKQALDVADEKPEGTIFVIPLKLEPCDAPDRLHTWQWVNYYEEGAYKRLFRTYARRKN